MWFRRARVGSQRKLVLATLLLAVISVTSLMGACPAAGFTSAAAQVLSRLITVSDGDVRMIRQLSDLTTPRTAMDDVEDQQGCCNEGPFTNGKCRICGKPPCMF